MSGQPEVTGLRSGSRDSPPVNSGYQDDQTGSHGCEERKLSEKIVQFMKVVKDIDDVLDTWTEITSKKIFIKLSSKEIVCLQNIEDCTLDKVLLDIDQKRLTSFSSYLSLPDSIMRDRLAVSMSPRQVHRPPRGASECGEHKQTTSENGHVGRSNITNDQNAPVSTQAFTFDRKVEVKGKPPSMFRFLKLRRSSESTLFSGNISKQNTLDAPACSSNIMNYTRRKNSDTNLNGRDLAKLNKPENLRNRTSPTGSTSEIAQLFRKLTRQVSEPEGLKRNNSLGACSFTVGSNKDDCSSSSSSFSTENLELAETDVETEQDRNVADNRTMYSSAPNISFPSTVEGNNQSSSEFDRINNVKVGPAQPGMVRSGSLKVLNFFRNMLPGERPSTSQSLSLPRRLSMDSQLTSNRIPMFERDNITLGKRTIKLNRPDQSHTMYISAANTLGGLPEDEEIHFPPRYLPAQINLLDENVHNYLTSGRRASCPVIVETEESDDHFSSSRFCLLSVKSKARDFLSENSEIDENEETVHSLDEGGHMHSPLYKTICPYDKCEPDFTDSDQSSESLGGAVESENLTFLEGVTFIVDKRPKLREGQLTLGPFEGKDSSSGGSSADRDNPNSTSLEESVSSTDKLKERRSKVFKKKKTKNPAKNTHSTCVNNAPITNTCKVHLSCTSQVSDETVSDVSQQSNNFSKENGHQGEITLNEHNNNSLAWSGSSGCLSSLVRQVESSSYCSDISDN